MRILIAETSWASMTAARDLAQSGYLLTRANDGQELYEYADLSEQNVILFDADLPDMKPLDALRRLRAARPDTAICVLADPRDLDFRLKAFELGADDVISRRTEVAELVARLQAVARRRAGLARSEMHFGELVIDGLNRVATLNGFELPLTRLEYELLEFLAFRQGQVTDKEAIMAQLYALDEAPDAKIIGVYVHHIRAKIAELGGDPSMLSNLRGRGYVLGEPLSLAAAA